MDDLNKTREQLIDELAEKRQRIAELERLVKLYEQIDKLKEISVKPAKKETQSHKEIKSLCRPLNSIIQIVDSIVKAKDPYVASHQQRVTNLACAIAEELNLPSDRVEGIRMASAIHDIGKIFVPTKILKKPGRLDDDEIDEIRWHPQTGYDLLKEVQFPWPVAEIILHHHERIDGSGYPHGLTDSQIHFEAKILAIADVIEAMTSIRIFRPAYAIKKALKEIITNSGILYDSKVVKVCSESLIEKSLIP
jgi:HD-GYP domain-containing protein (c-di-GMP phosphodiesterase class II)